MRLFVAIALMLAPCAYAVSPGAGADIDVGAPSFAGSGSFNNGVITVTGSGRDISPNSASQYNFYYYQLTGDGSITARVVSLTKTATYAKAGVMMQQSPYPGSATPWRMRSRRASRRKARWRRRSTAPIPPIFP